MSRAETDVRVTDRTYEAMASGAEFQRWPGDVAPNVGQRVVVFDRNMDFTQHDVARVEGLHVWVGPAVAWPSVTPASETPST